MGIYIKGMEMPTTCEECLGYREDGWYGASCLFLQDEDGWAVEIDDGLTDEYDLEQERHPNCPLVEFPTPHGRLIDEDTFICRIDDSFRMAGLNGADYRKVKRWLKNARTILEAEEQDDI